MKMTINLNEAVTYIPSGRISNIFKFLNLKNIHFEENEFLKLQKNKEKNNFLSEEKLFKIAEGQIKGFVNNKKEDHQYYYNQLTMKTIPGLINYSKIEKFQLNQIIEEKKLEILENKQVKEKMDKLKKLKAINSNALQ